MNKTFKKKERELYTEKRYTKYLDKTVNKTKIITK